MKYLGITAVFGCLLAGAAAQQSSSNRSGSLPPLPPGEGRELVESTCTACHNLKMIFQGRKAQAAWAKDVNDMIQRGAAVFPEEIEPITAYLSKNFGPDVSPLINVNTATREELGTIPNIKPAMIDRILDARAKAGPFRNSEDLRRALGLEKDDFAKEFYLLRYN